MNRNGQEIVAGLHHVDGVWHIAVRRGEQRWHHETARDEAALLQVLRSTDVSRVAVVVPAHDSVCRVQPIEVRATSEAASTLELLGESMAAGDVPSHRRAAGLLPGDGASRQALLTAWRRVAPQPDLPRTIEVTWVPEIACLAMLLDGSRVVASHDASTGSIAMVAGFDGSIRVRQVVETVDDAWNERVMGIVEETCEAIGISPPDLTIRDRTGVLGADRLEAIARGAAEISLHDDPLVRCIGHLSPIAREEEGSFPERAIAWLNTTRNQRLLTAVAVLLIAVLPLAIAGGRLALLKQRAGPLGGDDAARHSLEVRSAMYEQLLQDRVPMTKLLADISALAPVGIEFQSISIDAEQGVGIKGLARPHGERRPEELISEFQKNLAESPIVRNPVAKRTAASQGSTEFDWEVELDRPLLKVRRAEGQDFAERILAEVLYGEGAENTGVAGASSSRRTPDRSSFRRTEADDSSTRESSSSGPGSRRPTSGATSAKVPEPLTDDAIKAMSRLDQVRGIAARTKLLAPDSGISSEDRTRLEDEVRRLREAGGR